MQDNFEELAIEIDSDTVNQDFDNYDLYGERMIGDDIPDTDILFE